MCRHTIRGMIVPEDIEKMVRVAYMVDKMREAKLKWFWYVIGDAFVRRRGRFVYRGIEERQTKQILGRGD